jgi:glycosyltransferase involved in cell wall biosynthesis
MLSVVLLTYNRLEYAKRTLKSLVANLKSPDPIKWIVASDGDTDEYLRFLGDYAVCELGIEFSLTNSERGGYGKNYNLAMQAAHENAWVMPVEDDWELLRELNVNSLVWDMKELDIGCARLGYVGYTQELRGTLAHGHLGHWLRFDATSPEPHVFAGHPRIESRTWSRMVGPWPEGLLPGETEFEVAHRKPARTGVAWPLDVLKPSGYLFAHIGTKRSW